jgi:DNA primase large subunit
VALIGPEYVAVLDPFSKEGKEIVKASPPLDQMPPEIANLAVERVGKSDREMAVGFNVEAVRADVLSFYLACQGVAAVSYPYSRETRLLSEATNRTIKYRMYDLFRHGHENFCLETVQRSFNFLQLDRENGIKLGKIEIPREDYFKLRDKRLAEDGVDIVDDRLLAQYIPKYAVRWTDLALLLKHRRVELTKLYLLNGWAVISPRELWDLFASFVSAKTEEYVSSVYERFSDGGPPSKLLVEVGERIASLLPPEVELLGRFARLPAGKLKPELFPPCIRKSLVGVGAGLRNYAITVLLTSFLSYARVSPSGKMASRMADFISDVSIVRDDIASPIFEAADRCNPPLFKDQPQEKANVYYHLGFGMTTEPRLEDSGKSKWYRTPNCRKVQMSTPPLCDPDELCRTLKNPLTYYYRRLFEQSKLSAGD